MKLEKQIEYWINGASDAYRNSRNSNWKNKILHGLFFCHLALEKATKALVVKNTTEYAPKSHNLFYLLEKANVDFDEENYIFIGIISVYQLEGRYPTDNIKLPHKKECIKYLAKTKEIVKWIKKQF